MSTAPNSSEHRRIRRKKGKRSTAISCRKGTLGLGKDLALGLLDLSEEGAKLLVKEAIRAGEEVELSLAGVGVHKRVVVFAIVMWCKTESANFSIGVKFRERLAYLDYFNLT